MPGRYSRLTVGVRLGRLTVLARYHDARGQLVCLCGCACGGSKMIRAGSLVDGYTRSCGCLASERISKANYRHGLIHTAEYAAWARLRQRCHNEGHQDYHNYGGRGISVCERWNDFENFLADMGPKPSPELSIDRINNYGNYEPGNCRWATAKQQANNRRPMRRRRKATTKKEE